MHKVIIIVLTLTGVALSQNITVNETDTSQITLVNANDALICQFGSNGTLGTTAGCYNVVPSSCTDSVAMQQNAVNSSATFKFNGTAIFINSLQYQFSPEYTVTLNGESTDVDGYAVPPANSSFSCAAPLFSKSGLDKNSEHTIVLASKGRSPSRTDSQTDVGVFSLISFVYTTDNTTNTSPSGSATTSSANSPDATQKGTSSSIPNAIRISLLKVSASLTVVLALARHLS
ncbi:hypothetical protein BDP27DRAFT_1429036 [Rhodocollybia butyracea]|uniref:Uncharacterized protein n=1 Tax=Rhodocollybia butyracea TaxID=206335 RepID=A0A9P5U1A5_9AGAR|nr:hypothetical protein BDP27DRAFT_1429036 [Rhodocollybia butyracea]